MLPNVSSGGFYLLGLQLRLLEPVRDLVLFLLPCHLSDLRDKGVLSAVCCASTFDLSVMSSILGALYVGPCRGVHINESSTFHPVHGDPRSLFSNQLCSSYVRGGSLIGDCHHVVATLEGNTLTGHEFLQSPEL